ncbi:hypothetical protein EPO17_01370 [Patescibacteria group bacterium]|nr:MAG: hypothetical protein EPO17_01370 [Patescibacteria group bacterium]
MDTRFQTSFIPKKPIVGSDAVYSSARVSAFFVVALILFLTSVASAAGVYVYEKTLEKANLENDKKLGEKEKSFEPATLSEIQVRNTQINAAKDILAKHIGVSDFMKDLSTLTLQSVRFKTFDYKYTSPEKITLSMKGEGRDFRSVALQSDIFAKKNTIFKDPIVSNLAVNTDGTIDFDFTASLVPSVVSYKAVRTTSAPSTTATPTTRSGAQATSTASQNNIAPVSSVGTGLNNSNLR